MELQLTRFRIWLARLIAGRSWDEPQWHKVEIVDNTFNATSHWTNSPE